jgi:5-methylcytosine-specific restriction endonuclease McrA
MSPRLWIFIICIVILYNIYYETNILKYFNQYKKYYKMALVVLFGLGALKIISYSPNKRYEHMDTLNTFVKLLPIDKGSKDLLTPFLMNDNKNNPTYSIHKLNNSGKNNSTKRSVSETKKKYVASLQNWKCKHCHTELSAWFEVDHKISLEHCGTNEVSNLEALCRECHGKKTSMEKL